MLRVKVRVGPSPTKWESRAPRPVPRAPCPVPRGLQGCTGCIGCRLQAAGLQAAGCTAGCGLHGLQGCPSPVLRVVACYHPRARVAQAARYPLLVAQAAQAFGEALNNGSAGGVIAEMGLNPTGLGVEPFLRALQACPGLPPPPP